MPETIAQTVVRWDLDGKLTSFGGTFNELHERLDFLNSTHYQQYIPTLGPSFPDYETRLRGWIDNLADEDDKRVLFEFAEHIAFFGRSEFAKLYQVALRGPIISWIVEQLGLDFTNASLQNQLAQEVHDHTWYCPFTDSMQISDFHHANHIGGIAFRPDWLSLTKFGDRARVLDFMHTRTDANKKSVPLRRIVLLEDFIGSGTQLSETVREEPLGNKTHLLDTLTFVTSLSPSIPVLLVPLIVCPDGAGYIRALAPQLPNFRFEPILELKPDEFICPQHPAPAGSFEEKVYNLAIRTYSQVTGNGASSPRPYSPFGVAETGARVVFYSNTPANTLAVIQHASNTWNPLFPRSARIR